MRAGSPCRSSSAWSTSPATNPVFAGASPAGKIWPSLPGCTTWTAQTAIPPVVEALRLTEYLDRRVFTYSTGIKRRLDIAGGMLHQPDILLLDEPITNLDSLSATELRQLLAQIPRTTRARP